MAGMAKRGEFKMNKLNENNNHNNKLRETKSGMLIHNWMPIDHSRGLKKV